MLKSKRSALVACNVVLAGAVVAAWVGSARAWQPASRARGHYTMVAGEIQSGGDASGIYITDSVNEEMVVLRWNNSRNAMDGIDYRDLADDATRKPGR